MYNLINKIKLSTPSLNKDESIEKFELLLLSNQYIVCSSNMLGFENTLALVYYFIEALAVMSMPDDSVIPALQPLHVLYFNNPEDPMFTTWGLYYQNGSVFYTEHKEDPLNNHLMLLLDKSFKEELNLQTTVISSSEETE